MKIGKRLLTIALVLTFCVSMIGSFGVNVYAASIRTYSTMDAIPEDLNVFNTMAKGTISAVNVSGQWYYQFTRTGYDTIRVRASAFASTSYTNAYLADDNAALTKAINSTTSTNNETRINYFVSSKKSTKVVLTNQNVDVFTTTRCRYELLVLAGTSDEIKLKSTLTNYVCFTYSSKVEPIPYIYPDYDYVTPSNAAEYVEALDRSLTLSEITRITPNIELSITNTGDLGVYLSDYTVSGKGSATTGINVSDLISVGYAATKLAALATPSFSILYNLFNLIKDVAVLTSPSSTNYNTGLYEPLSLGNVFVYKAKFISPIKLKKGGDCFQTLINLANIKSGYSGRGTANFQVNFSFS